MGAALTAASQVGYFGPWPARHRPRLAALWFRDGFRERLRPDAARFVCEAVAA